MTKRLRKPDTALVPVAQSTVVDPGTARLKELEGVIREELPGHIRSSVRIGAALREIKDSELFKPYFQDWDEYVTDQWGLSRSYTYQLIDAAKLVEGLQTSLEALGKSAIPDSTLLTIVGNEWRARQLKGREAKVVQRVQKGEDPQKVVDDEIVKAKREHDRKAKQRQEQKELTARAAVDASGAPKASSNGQADADDTDNIEILTNKSGGILPVTRTTDRRVLTGTAKGGKRLVADQKSVTVKPSLAACRTDSAEELAGFIEHDVKTILSSRYILSKAVRGRLRTLFTKGLEALDQEDADQP